MPKLANKTLAKWLVGCLGIPLIGLIIYLVPMGRELTVGLLGKMGPVAVPLLRHALQDEDHRVQWAARDALRKLGPRAVPSLLRALTDKNARVRVEAVEALSVLDDDGKDALPALIAAFNDSDDAVRVKAMGAIRYLGHEENVGALPTLLEILRDDPNGYVRAQAVEAAGILGHLKVELVTPVLIQSLKDPDGEVRAESAEALGRLARHRVMPREAIPALREALNDPNKNVRDEAAEALSMVAAGGRNSADKE
jgi:HEAT repeat protein